MCKRREQKESEERQRKRDKTGGGIRTTFEIESVFDFGIECVARGNHIKSIMPIYLYAYYIYKILFAYYNSRSNKRGALFIYNIIEVTNCLNSPLIDLSVVLIYLWVVVTHNSKCYW